MRNSTIDVSPIAGSLGAEVSGVDLSQRLSDAVADEIRAAFVEHQVLFFHDQHLTPEQQIAFSGLFGPVTQVPYIKPLDDYPEIVAVLKEADENNIATFGGDWHSDFSYLEEPPAASLLYGLEIPAFGGDTLWADMYAAFEALSPGMQHKLEQLNAMHSGHVYGSAMQDTDLRLSRSIEISRGNAEADVERPHPVVRVHPDSGRKALFVNPIYTTRLENMTRAESRPILRFLYDHCTRPEFTCRFRWSTGALAVWDNRCTLHYAVNDYDGSRRLLHRTATAGDRPIPAA